MGQIGQVPIDGMLLDHLLPLLPTRLLPVPAHGQGAVAHQIRDLVDQCRAVVVAIWLMGPCEDN